jgi:hypothetical protein
MRNQEHDTTRHRSYLAVVLRGTDIDDEVDFPISYLHKCKALVDDKADANSL